MVNMYLLNHENLLETFVFLQFWKRDFRKEFLLTKRDNIFTQYREEWSSKISGSYPNLSYRHSKDKYDIIAEVTHVLLSQGLIMY